LSAGLFLARQEQAKRPDHQDLEAVRQTAAPHGSKPHGAAPEERLETNPVLVPVPAATDGAASRADDRQDRPDDQQDDPDGPEDRDVRDETESAG